MRRLPLLLLALVAAAVLAAPILSPNPPDASFTTLLNAPPTRIHVVDAAGELHAPFIYPWRRISQLEQTYEEDRATRVPLQWLSRGRLVTSGDAGHSAPLLLLGADAFGRDVFSRTLYGGRLTLGIALLAALGALALGGAAGSLAGYRGGLVDDLVMRTTDLVLLLPTMYVVMVLRASLPLVLSTGQVFVLLAGVFAIVGAPLVARVVRGVVRRERTLEYATAAESLGAGPARVLFRHLLPAAAGAVAAEVATLIPGFVVAEATLSYVGFGFPDAVPTWGTLLHEAANVRALVDFPWLFAPALAIFIVVLAVNAGLSRRPVGLRQ